MHELSASGSVVKLRPHYVLRGSDLYFLASSRPARHLTDAEADLVRLLANEPAGIELATLPFESAQPLNLIVDCGFADILAPLKAASEHHLVVIEPHMDDAILSVGGQMLLRKGRHRITILSVFGISNYTSYMEVKRPYLDHEEITRLRNAESTLAAAMVGAQFQSLALHDAPLRQLPPEQWSKQFLSEQIRMTRGFLGSLPIPHVIREVALELERTLQTLAPDEVWIPLGLGTHVDHRTCRSACLQALASTEGKHSQLPVRLYEDLPYSQQTHRKQILDAFKSAGTKLTLLTEDISDVMDEKLRAVEAFSSQFKVSFMAPRLLRAASEVAKNSGYLLAGEQSYLLDRPFQMPPETELAINRHSLLDFKSVVKTFTAKVVRHQRLNILVLPSGILGSISEVAVALSSVLPDTTVVINVIEDARRNISLRQFGKISLKFVPATSWQAKLLLIWEIAHIGAPTIVVRWGALQGSFVMRALLKTLGGSRPLVVAPSLTDICAVWEEMECDQ